MRFVISAIGNILSLLYAKIFLITVIRRQKTMNQGTSIYVVNHPNTLDPFYLLGIIGERVAILITEHVFHIPVIGALVRHAGHIMVTSDGRSVYEQAKNTLLSGRSIVVFAEGEVSHGPSKLRTFHTGAVRLAMETGAPIVPIGIHLDKERIWKRKTVIKDKPLIVTWYRYGWYTVVFGDSYHTQGMSEDRALVRRETVLLRQHVLSCVTKGARVVQEDRLLHKRRVKQGFHTGLRGVYRFVCFVGFFLFKLNDVGVKILG